MISQSKMKILLLKIDDFTQGVDEELIEEAR